MKWLTIVFVMIVFTSFSQKEGNEMMTAFEHSIVSNSREAYIEAKQMYSLKEEKELTEEEVDRILVAARYFRDMEFVTTLYATESKQSACGCGTKCNKHHHKHD